MKTLTPAIALIALSACSSAEPELGFTLVSRLDARTQGLTVADGAVASAAMDGQICLLDVGEGVVVGDADIGAGDDTLLDAMGERVLVAGSSLVALPRDLDADAEPLGLPTGLDGRLWADGAVALYDHDDGCGVAWSDAPTETWVVPETDCQERAALAVDRRTGTAWIADGARIAQIARSGTYTSWHSTADQLAFDPSTGRVLAGRTGEAWLGAFDDRGEVAWSTGLGGTLVDVDTAGTSGAAAVMLDEDGGGTLVVTGTDTGLPLAEFAIPEPTEVSMADDGSTMALVRPDEVLFYRVDADDGWLESPESDNAEPRPLVAGAVLGATAAGAGTVVGTALLVATMVD